LVYQGNGNGELVAKGLELDDWVSTPKVTLRGGSPGQFDSCGSWMMRAITLDNGNIAGFYHAETACDYNNNGQTRKSCGYSVSQDGGNTFTKPNYPYNRVVDTATSIATGLPSGEGDFGVVLRDNWYYLFFANVETYHTGVARATRSSDGYPGAFYKYYNGQWNQPGVGGNSSRLNNVPGPQAYLHTPSNSFITSGNFHPYWNNGFMMSVSDNALDWKYFADPIVTPDPVTNNDQFMYPSFMGSAGGFDIGNKFQFFYMWISPEGTWNTRYQIVKEVSLSYVGYNNTSPSTKIALTTFRSTENGETWQSTEIALAPYKPVNIVGYLMSRPYPNSFVVYDCYNYTVGDHFVGTADECFHSGAGVVATRTMGYIWSVRQKDTVAVYRCYNAKDIFLSTDPMCEGRASSQTVPFGYMMTGPALTNSGKGFDTLIPQGSKWKFYNGTALSGTTWTQRTFSDSAWTPGQAPFSTGYSSDLRKTPFGPRNHYFRTEFNISSRSAVKKVLLSVASDDYAMVYINGVLVDSDSVTWHEAAFWNRRVYIDPSVLTTGVNTIAVLTKNGDAWAFFDLELSAKYNDEVAAREVTCSVSCGSNGQCVNGKCECDIGWTGSSCSTNLCSYSDSNTQMVITPGSSFRHTPWNYVPSSPAGWFAHTFDDSWWQIHNAPFATSSYSDRVTTISGTRHLYRKKFLIEVPYGKTIMSATLSIATDDTHRVYVNGKFLGASVFPYKGQYYNKRWNDVIEIAGSLMNEGVNVIAIEVPLVDGRWTAYFDMQLAVSFAVRSCAPPPSAPSIPTPRPTTLPTPTPRSTPSPSTPAPTAAPPVAPTTRPTVAPTTAPTVAPTTAPTVAPTTAPTVAPTTAPTVAPTTAPTVAPTTRPTSSPANSVKLNLYQGSSVWWFAVSLAGARASEVTKMEIRDSGTLTSFKEMTVGWADIYTYQPSAALVLPITIRASLPSGSSISFSVSSFSTPTIDSGVQFP